MVTISDFIRLPLTDQTQADAIDYAGRSIHYTYNRMNYDQVANRLLRIAVGIVIEKGFEAYLRRKNAQYSLAGRTHWRLKDKAEFIVNGLHIDVKGYHVYPASGRDFPGWFLDTEGLVPEDQLMRVESAYAYCQAFLVSPQRNSSTTHRFVAIFPPAWGNRWREGRTVSLVRKDSSPAQSEIVLCGEDPDMIGKPNDQDGDVADTIAYSQETTRRVSNTGFSSLQYAWTSKLPTDTIDVIIDRDGSHTIQVGDWHDLWLASPIVYLTACGTKADYQNGHLIPTGTNTRVYTNGTRTPNYAVPIRGLRPLSELLELG